MNSSHPPNRLARESSPYLRLHAQNPVDWFPWGAEAIARAKELDRPIFLSVGYSTCYWCHVMERESFSDPAVAAEMNRLFVNVKVDREERPDLDEIYMLATQILSGQGGWPNSVFLTPRLEPFFAGTYFPPEDAHGRPSFRTVLQSLDHAWRERRDDVDAQASELGEAMRRHLDEIEPFTEALPGREPLERSFAGLRQRFDPTWGGFGQQPKFPTPSNLWLLEEVVSPRDSRELVRPEGAVSSDQTAAKMMLSSTLDQMARGGLFDQLAGGFHRYATDREWRIPHFEKMLYDNGLLLELYAREHARTGSLEARRVALETAAWLAREMSSPEGAFWSALDAETDGHEGAYFVWTRAELDAALGVENGEFAAPLLGFADEPFFEHDAYVLHLPRPLDVQARQRRTTYAALVAELDPLRARLLAARSRRERPATDDKLLADWNGIAIAGLAEAGRSLGVPELIARAARAAEFVCGRMRGTDGVLLHAWRAGEGKIAAFLSDYVFLIRGLLRLHEASGEGRWLDEAVRLEEEQASRLASPKGGYFNAREADDLLFRSKELFDGAMPAANAVAALNLLDLHAATGEARYLAEAERTVRAFVPIVTTHPDGARTMCIALARLARAQASARTRRDANDGKNGGTFIERKDKEATAAVTAAPGGAGATGAASAALAGAPTGIVDREADVESGGAKRSAGVAPRPSSSFPSMEASPSLSSIFRTLPEVELLPAVGAGSRELRFRCELRDGWHLVIAEERTVPALGVEGGEIVDLAWPEPVDLFEQDGGEAVRALVGAIEARGRLRRDAPRVRLLFRFEACGEGRCQPVQELDLGEV